MMESVKLVAFSAALVTVLMQVMSQLILRWQVSDMAHLPPAQLMVKAFSNPWVWVAMIALLVGMATWLITLSRISLNQAYPLVALTIPITALLSTYLFQEHLPVLRSAGIALIVLGVVLVGRS